MRQFINLAFFILAAFCIQSYAQTFEIDRSILNESATGTRAAGMGRAYTAMSNDTYALSWNPAGLSSVKKTMATISGSIGFGNIYIDPPQLIKTNKSYKALQAGSFGLKYVGFVIPLPTKKYKMVTSLAVRNLADLNDSVTLTTIDLKREATLDETTERSGGLFALSGGIGINILRNLNLGASFNILTGQQTLENKTNFSYNGNTSETWEKWQNKFSGLSFDFGFQWKASKKIWLGSRLTFPHTIHYTDIRMEDSNQRKREYPIGASLSKPLSVAYGLAVFPIKDVTFVFDYIHRPWKKIKTTVNETEANDLFANASSFHMGIEYVIRGHAYLVPWRIGFFTRPEQIFDYNSKDPDARGDQVSSHFVTGGFGIVTRTFHINFALEYQILQYKFDMGIADNPFGLRQSKFNATFGIEMML